MKSNNHQISIIKITLGIVFAMNAGERIGYSIASVSIPFFMHSFFPLVCVLAIQWILFSRFLPKQWFVNGLIGCLISACFIQIMRQITRPSSPFNPPDLKFYLLDAFMYFLMGLVAVLPQSIFLGKQGVWWILLNAVGWSLNHIFASLWSYPFFNVPSLVLPIAIANGLPLGLLLSLYLYKVANGEYKQNMK